MNKYITVTFLFRINNLPFFLSSAVRTKKKKKKAVVRRIQWTVKILFLKWKISYIVDPGKIFA